MSDLGRFRKLERRRADGSAADDADRDASAAHSQRFNNIEVRRAASEAEGEADPFAPPRVRSAGLEIAEDDRREAKALRAAHNARTEESLAVAKAEREAERELFQPPRGPLVQLDTRDRLLLLAGGTALIAGLAQLVSVYFWGLLPVLVIGLGVGLLLRASPPA